MPLTYQIGEHDGGYAYRVNDVWSEPFPDHATALAAAKAASLRQQLGGEDTDISFETVDRRWQTEHVSGGDRPETRVVDTIADAQGGTDVDPSAGRAQAEASRIASTLTSGQTHLASTNDGTDQTEFGLSVESQAQIRDASTTEETAVELLNIYRLEPTAAPTDPRWDNSPNQGVVVVAARTSGDARIVASERELDFMEVDSAPAEDVTTSHASAFRSEKLYTVIELEHGRRDLTRGVLDGNISVATIRPVLV